MHLVNELFPQAERDALTENRVPTNNFRFRHDGTADDFCLEQWWDHHLPTAANVGAWIPVRVIGSTGD